MPQRPATETHSSGVTTSAGWTRAQSICHPAPPLRPREATAAFSKATALCPSATGLTVKWGPRSSVCATMTRTRSTSPGAGGSGERPSRVRETTPRGRRTTVQIRSRSTGPPHFASVRHWRERRRRAHLPLMAGYARFSSLCCAQKRGPVSHGRGHPDARSLEDGGGHEALHAHATGGLRRFCRHCVQNGRRSRAPSRTPSHRSRELRRRDLGRHR